MEFILCFILLTAFIVSLYPIYKKAADKKKMKSAVLFNLIGFFSVCGLMIIYILAIPASAAENAEEAVKSAIGIGEGLKYLGAALATGMSSIGAGIAVGAGSTAAIGATSENPKMLSKGLIFVALGEGVALYGLLISILILFS